MWVTEPRTRERAFLSGMIEVALSRNMLPDELLRWIFQSGMSDFLLVMPGIVPADWLSVPSEPRDDLRHAYCRIFKVRSLLRVTYKGLS